MNATPEEKLSQRTPNRRLFRWLFGLASLLTVVALFYAVENWRGKRAWQQCRRQLAAARLDWDAFIPPPVPDEQNFFKAPKMKEWFVKGAGSYTAPSYSNELSGRLSGVWKRLPASTGTVVVAELKVVSPDANSDSAGAGRWLRFDDPAARQHAEKLIRNAIGPSLSSPVGNLTFVRPLTDLQPAQLIVAADPVPTLREVAAFFPTNATFPGDLRGHVTSAGSNVFDLSFNLSEMDSATDFLARSEPAKADFDLIREAVKRPYAQMESDYRQPVAIPIPNFVTVRNVAQALTARAQCHLLLGQPERAWRDLALVRDVCRLLEARPTGKPMTLVAAMINVAVTGLYAGAVADGLRLHAWGEPQLAAIQKQLEEINMLQYVLGGFECERAGVCRTLEATPPGELGKIFSFGIPEESVWQKLRNPRWLLIRIAPRGWIYQNMAAIAFLDQQAIDTLDVTNVLIRPRQADNNIRELTATFGHFSPYTFLAAISIANLTKATQTLARNQTTANEALIACALERYRLALKQYPENLDALSPQFLEKTPHDLIGGQPLKYHRTGDGQFVLYGVGWNERDDGGVPGKTIPEGDWVWDQWVK